MSEYIANKCWIGSGQTWKKAIICGPLYVDNWYESDCSC